MIGLGCMRLGAAAVIDAALDGGITLLDTADAYGEAMHDNERLVAAALAGRAQRPAVATKVGLVRPDGRWVNDGRARHLTGSAEESLAILGAIDLLQLHAVDPRTPLATSVRALAAIQRAGGARELGLCNVNIAQIEEARALAPIASVQTRLSVLDEGALRDGVVAHCLAHGLRVLAYRPLGGERARGRLERDEALGAVAARHGATPAEVALAWLVDLGVTPLPGPSRVATARSCAAALGLRLDDEDRARLDARMPGAAELRGRRARVAGGGEGEVVLIVGCPAAGKSTLARDFVARGYDRLNRDDRGGTLDRLAAELERRVAGGGRRFVLDNTYATRRSRAAVLEVAARHRLAARCVWLTTTLAEAQVNACERTLAAHGRLLGPEELKRLEDPGSFIPGAQFRYRRELEPPDVSEGFVSVETRPFERRADPARARRALLLDLDHAVWQSRAGARAPIDAGDVDIPAARLERLRAAAGDGWLLLGITWQPGVLDVAPLVARARELLGAPLDAEACTHPAGPPVCWCRKPLPGLGVLLAARHGVDPARSLHVGAQTVDRTFAERLGFGYVDAAVFYGTPA